MEIEVSPTTQVENSSEFRNTVAHIWILADTPAESLAIAKYNVERQGWRINGLKVDPIEVFSENFLGKDIGTNSFIEANERGCSIVYLGVTSNKELQTKEPVRLAAPQEVDLNALFVKQRETRQKGECLFPKNNDSCDEIISAHSIQKSGALSLIARDSKVYTPSVRFSDIKRNKGRIAFELKGIQSTSTFRGFCKKHDNFIFGPIDDELLKPTKKQAFLYAYRSLCREILVKKNALESYNHQLEYNKLTEPTRALLDGAKKGTEIGLKNLDRQKNIYDRTYLAQDFDQIAYTAFVSKSKPSVVFSGGLFPETGFMGEQIQKLGMPDLDLDMLTFSFAPMNHGWALLFAWHKASENSSKAFLGSFARVAHESKKFNEILFSMVMSSCENIAICPEWYDSLKPDQVNLMSKLMSMGSNPLSPSRGIPYPDAISSFCPWRFDSVQEQ